MNVKGRVALIEIENPPVNALSFDVRVGLVAALDAANEDPCVAAILIVGRGRTFIAGADIREFGQPPKNPLLPEVVNRIEDSNKPVIVAMHGSALGGGLEIALGAHYRIASSNAKFALPEVSLGLLPGAGGTQRLPRLVGVETALSLISSGRTISAKEALEIGLIDKLAENEDISAAGVDYAESLLLENATVRPTGAMAIEVVDPVIFEEKRAILRKKAAGQLAPQKCVDAVEAAQGLPFAEGLAKERALFRELMDSDQRAALIHAFFSERQVVKLPEIEGVAPRTIAKIGVVGGGTMGSGIAVAALLSGLDVTLVERDEEAAAKAKAAVSKLLLGSVKRGKLREQAYDSLMQNTFRTRDDYASLSDVDLVIEAVFESMDVKKEVFSKLDAICKPGAILATNTSYLDVDAVAQITNRPEDVIGLHFFSPAHIMRLLEIVVGEKTSPEVVATGFAFAKIVRKIAVRAGVCDGFIGNRILAHYKKAIDGAVLAGASPFAVDQALVNFGLAMGPFAVGDLAGLDIGWANRKRVAPSRDPLEVYAEFSDRLCEQGHFGRKTGKGYYIHDSNGSLPNPEVEALIAAERAEKGIVAQQISEEEIVDRYMAAMINEAARVVEEGIALRPLDVDVTLMNGYGFPRWRGGPLHYADTVGLEKILNDINKFAAEDAFLWRPAPLIERLVAEGENFASLNV